MNTLNKQNETSPTDKAGVSFNPLLSAVIHYIKSQLGLIAMIACLVLMYDANVWDWKYWVTAILTWLAYGYSGNYNYH